MSLAWSDMLRGVLLRLPWTVSTPPSVRGVSIECPQYTVFEIVFLSVFVALRALFLRSSMDTFDGVTDKGFLDSKRSSSVCHRHLDSEVGHPYLFAGAYDPRRDTPFAGLLLPETAGDRVHVSVQSGLVRVLERLYPPAGTFKMGHVRIVSVRNSAPSFRRRSPCP